MSQQQSFVANGDIEPARFVTIADESRVAQSVTGDRIIGVSQNWQKNTPIAGQSVSTLAAEAGDQIVVYGEGEDVSLEMGETVSAGDALKPDAVGRAIAVDTTATDASGAVALQDGVLGEKIRCRVEIHVGS
ncbi:hypothetical protein KAR91_20165 [Candidatus Pacearchaeota archaeon]|nr:hypothetical protein [Candidatus Pacearchaeota archaeon]